MEASPCAKNPTVEALASRVFDVVHGFQILGCRFVFPVSRVPSRPYSFVRAHTLLILFARRLERLAIILLYVLFKLFILALLHLVRVLHPTLVVLGLANSLRVGGFSGSGVRNVAGVDAALSSPGTWYVAWPSCTNPSSAFVKPPMTCVMASAHGVENAGTFAQALVRDIVGSARLRFQFIGGRR